MNMLFDISPEEPQKRRHARPSAASADSIEPPFKKTIPPLSRPILSIGKIDHTIECVDPRCGTACHDILMEDGGDWLLQCCFCNCSQWAPAIPGHLAPRAEAFVFRDGRFFGLSIDEAVALPRGRDYVEWAAKEHKRPAVRQACKAWLDASQPVA